MRARLLMIGIAGFTCGAAAAAAGATEPAKAPVRNADQAIEQAVPVVVASADQVRTAAAAAQQQEGAAPAPKRRVARVTTCRCGDQLPTD